jgi:hypothetical protein
LEEVSFISGVDRGKWELVGGVEAIKWPFSILWVQAVARLMSDSRIFLRFNLENYPKSAPTACPWDIIQNCKLQNGSWPRGPYNVSTVFNPGWNNGMALYAPCDRVAMQGHDGWQHQFPQWWWRSDFTIVKYLEFVHQCLNCGYENEC